MIENEHHRDVRLTIESNLTRSVEIRNSQYFILASFSLAFFIAADKLSDAQMKDPQKEASELRERLLREKIKKMRKSSFESVDAQANGLLRNSSISHSIA
jgi:hypothetical protein